MIGLTFSLTGMLVFMLYVMVHDLLIMIGDLIVEIEKSFGHDTLIFQDYEYEIDVDKQNTGC
jgi:hypothetical protein